MEFDCRERARLAPCGAIFIDLAQWNEHVYCLRAKSLLRQLYQLRFPSPGFLAANGVGCCFWASGSCSAWNVSCPGGGYGCERDGFG